MSDTLSLPISYGSMGGYMMLVWWYLAVNAMLLAWLRTFQVDRLVVDGRVGYGLIDLERRMAAQVRRGHIMRPVQCDCLLLGSGSVCTPSLSLRAPLCRAKPMPVPLLWPLLVPYCECQDEKQELIQNAIAIPSLSACDLPFWRMFIGNLLTIIRFIPSFRHASQSTWQITSVNGGVDVPWKVHGLGPLEKNQAHQSLSLS